MPAPSVVTSLSAGLKLCLHRRLPQERKADPECGTPLIRSKVFTTDMLKLPEQFDDAVMGVSQRIGWENCIVYDAKKIIEILTEDMSEQDALDHFDFNIAGSYVGDTTPVFLWRETIEDMNDGTHLLQEI